MPDFDQLLAERVTRPLSAVAPPLASLQRRAARRRQRKVSVVAVASMACVALVVAAPSVPWTGSQRETSGFASGVLDGVLDAGTDRSGPWRLVVAREEGGLCVQRLSATGRLPGACVKDGPGRLSQAAQFPTYDGDEYIVVLAGPTPAGTNRIEVTAGGNEAVATITEVEGQLFWSARLPPYDGGTRAVAYDVAGAVLDELSWPAKAEGQLLPTPEAPLVGPTCPTAVNAETGERTCASG